MQGLKQRVIKWNRDRGLLDTFDPSNELRMLSEEAREFYLADTFEHQLQEYVDFCFVAIGTVAKFHASTHQSHTAFTHTIQYWEALSGWMESAREEMYDTLSSSAEGSIYSMSLKGLIAKSLLAVTECNELKGADKVDGKVVKNKDHIDPLTKIKEIVHAHKRN